MEKRTIDVGMLIMMLAVSILIDVIQLLLDLSDLVIPGLGFVLNIMIDGCMAWIYWLWFTMCGVKFTKGPATAFVVGIIADAIPFISSFGWTLDVLMVYFTAKTKVETVDMLK
jgi:hypothetical protein